MKKLNLKKTITHLTATCLITSAMPFAMMSSSALDATLWGDSNCDGVVTIADVVAAAAVASAPNDFSLSEQGTANADVHMNGDGISATDASVIQEISLGLYEGKELPVSYSPTNPDPVTDVTYIHLQGSSITVEGDNAVADGSKVTITASGEFYVDGTLDDGQIYVNIADETVDAETVKIFLNGVSITGSSAPAIYIENAENTSINLMNGTSNYISDGEVAYDGDYLNNAVIHAKDDITIKGTGSLDITANTQYAIHCNNDLKITDGIVNVSTLTTDAIRGATSVTVKGGTITIDSEGDGIKSTKGNVSIEAGTLNIKAGNDAIQAETTIDISGGNVIAGGDRGLTSITGTNITGGSVVATATDNQADLVNATQGTILLNCVDDTTTTDGCWKKANAIEISENGTSVFTANPVKKYRYVLISDSLLTSGKTYNLTNTSTSAVVTHNNGASNTFSTTASSTTFETVNLANGDVVDPPVVTDGYTITLASSGLTTNAPSSVATVSNNIITIVEPGVFAISGEMTGGQIVVNVDKTAYPEGLVELDLMGVNLTNTTDSPIYVASIGDEVQIVAKNGYENTISDGTSYTNADGKMGAIYSCDDLKIKGQGTLTVNGNCEDAIVSKNDLKLYNGNIIINAVDDAIRGKDSVTIGNSTDTDFSTLNVTVKTSQGDGIKSTETDTTTGKGFITVNGGTINITAYSDGFHASQLLTINGGDIDITTNATITGGSTGGSTGGRPGQGSGSSSSTTDVSSKGLKAGCTDDTTAAVIEGTINILNGTVNVNSADDSVHATFVNIKGADMTLSSGDDGVHADNTVTIDNGSINVTKSYEGIEGSIINVNGGNISIVSSDDGFNAAGGNDSSGNTGGGWGQGGFSSSTGTLTFNGGYAFIRANGDVIDSNGDLFIKGGTIIACGPTSGGNGIFDKGDGNYQFSITGGTVFGIGSSDMMETPSCSNGTYISKTGVSLQAGSLISVADANGNAISVLKVPADMSMTGAVQYYSANATSSHSLYSGGTYNGTLNANGYADGGSISGASSIR